MLLRALCRQPVAAASAGVRRAANRHTAPSSAAAGRAMATPAPAGSSGAAAGTPGSSTSMPSPAAALDFLMLLTNLKTTKRTGWVKCNVQQPESIADHMYRMGMMSLLASDCGVDAGHCMRLALVHDVAEALVGDITPHCNVSDGDKHAMEAAAVQEIKGMLGNHTQAAADVEALWHEYEAQATPESHLVKDFDKLEMIIQAHEYECAQPGLGSLQQFFDSTAGKFKTPTGRAWAAELVRRREQQQRQRAGQPTAAADAAAGGTPGSRAGRDA